MFMGLCVFVCLYLWVSEYRYLHVWSVCVYRCISMSLSLTLCLSVCLSLVDVVFSFFV